MTKLQKNQLTQSRVQFENAIQILLDTITYADPKDFGDQWENLKALTEEADQFGAMASTFFAGIIDGEGPAAEFPREA